MTFGTIFQLIGGLGVFLFGMKIMSESLQMVAGNRLKAIMRSITSNRFLGVFTGFLITAIVQSSSATTVMLVSFVNAELITLIQSIGVIMGANNGTTITGWIVAILGFKIKISSFALPAVGIGFFARFFKNERLTNWGMVLIGFGLLFLGLSFLKHSVPNINESPELAAMIHRFQADGLGSTIMVLMVGTIITMIIQSSSATMAVTLTAAANGLIDFQTAAALVLGENIGTTITANLATIGANVDARRTARVHMVFNIFGVIWAIAIFRQLVGMVDHFIPGDPGSDALAIPTHLAAFHTNFNITNTVIMLPFVKYLARLGQFMVWDSQDKMTGIRHLNFTLIDTPNMAIFEARQQIYKMMLTTRCMFREAIELINDPGKNISKSSESIKRQELTVDQAEREILDFLAHISRVKLNKHMAREIRQMMKMVADVERIADHCESIMLIINRSSEQDLKLPTQSIAEITEMTEFVDRFITTIIDGFTSNEHIETFHDACMLEDSIDGMRDKIRDKNIARLNSGESTVTESLIYFDMLTNLEKIGEHAFNIAEALANKR